MSWEIDYDPAVWLPVPDLPPGPEADEWVGRAAGAVAADFASEFSLAADYASRLRYQLGILADLAHEKGPDYGDLLAHLPGPDWAPFPVFVGFREPMSESPDYLLEVAGATGLPAVQPPVVEHVVTDDLGEGVRVLRYEQDGELGLIANLCYAWRAHETDVFVFAQTDDLARLEEIQPDVAALTAAIRPIADHAVG